MNRRQFIASLGAAAAAVALAPLEKLAPAAKEAWLNTELTVGDVFTREGVYAINPLTGEEVNGLLQKFVVTAVEGSSVRFWPDDSVRLWPNCSGASNKIASNLVTPLHVGQTIPSTVECSFD